LAEQKALFEELEKRKQSQVVKKNLPRPLQINQKFLKSVSAEARSEAERLILEEL
jgi:hypothetical protein